MRIMNALGMLASPRYIARIALLISLTGVAMLVSTLPSPALARAATAREMLARLNAQRSANGIPAGITENAAWSADCASHDHYMALNHVLTHDERAGNPGYTAGGAFAGKNAVLSESADWDSGNPYEYAPLHLDQLLAPRLLRLGSADAEGFSCTTTFPGWTRAAPREPTVHTYPGDGASIYASEVAHELPWTPGDLVGLGQPSRTGPALIVLADAPAQTPIDNSATLTAASVTGPTGAVEVRTVDGTTALPQGGSFATLAPYIAPGGFIIPVRPLIPNTTYRAHVVVSFAGAQIVHDWSFTTRGNDPHSQLVARRGRLWFSSSSTQPIRVSFTDNGGASGRALTIRPGHSVWLKLAPGSWRACGRQAAGGGFDSYTQCLAVSVIGVPALRLGKPQTTASTVGFALRFGTVLRGRQARLTITSLALQCRQNGCSAVSGASTVRRITLRAGTLTLPLPDRGRGYEIELRTSAFQARGTPWASARASGVFLRR
ncbi:MAG: hypothetical protein JO179_07395 [Solirubrobacterales bacterium]|nr:hypothetical protein [Solirubrobacterales bacterium]